LHYKPILNDIGFVAVSSIAKFNFNWTAVFYSLIPNSH